MSSLKDRSEASPKPFQPDHFLAAFLLYFAGVLVATSRLLYEKWLHRMRVRGSYIKE